MDVLNVVKTSPLVGSDLDLSYEIEDDPVGVSEGKKEKIVFFPIRDQYGELVGEMWKDDIISASRLYAIPNENCLNC